MSVPYQGDYAPGAVITVWHNSFTSNDPAASVTMSNYTDTDVHIYKDDSLTQRQNTAGMALDIDVDGYAGVHKITITTADNTVNDFWEAGHDYAVVIEGTTIDGGTVNAAVATFSIANRRVAGQMCVSSIEGLTDQDTFTLTATEASGDDDAYNGCTIIVTDQTTKIQKAVGHILDYTGNTRSVQLHAAPLQTNFTMAVGDSVEIFATAAFANINTVKQTLTNLHQLMDATTSVAADANLDGIVVDASVLSHLMTKGADTSDYAATTDSQEGLRDTLAPSGEYDVQLDDNLSNLDAKLDTSATEMGKVPKSDSTVTWNATALGSIQSEANDALVALDLDHLINSAVADQVANDSIIAKLVSKDATADWSDYSWQTESLEALKDGILTDIETDTAQIGSGVALDSGTATIAGMLTKMADDSGGGTFDAGEDSLNKIRDDRTIAAAAYTVVGDTIAEVTNIVNVAGLGAMAQIEAAVDNAMDNVIPADGSPTARSRDDFLLRAGAPTTAKQTVNETTGAYSVKKIDAEATEEKYGNTKAASGTIVSSAGTTTRDPA